MQESLLGDIPKTKTGREIKHGRNAAVKIHPVAELFPMLSASELTELAEDIKTNGLQQDLVRMGDTLLDGRNRLAACEMAGVKPTFQQYAGDDPRAFIISANLHRRHLTESQRAMVAAKLANMKHGGDRKSDQAASLPVVSQSEAATLLNVSERSVRDAKLIARESPELAAQVASGEKTVHAAKQELRPHVAQATGDNEWYTPKPYIEAARAVMGKIDVDPASSVEANKVVKAETIHTAEDNGLKQEWAGKLWMNPPYASELVGKFIEKLAISVESGAVSEALVLVNNATETKWFARLASVSAVLCFPTGRVKFWHPRKESMPLQGQAVAYIGKHGKRFVSEFRQFGIVAEIVK
jgi:phage N-6-adenine-methyltransferase